MRSGGGMPGHVSRRNNGTAMRGQTTRRFSGGVVNQSLRGGSHERMDQSSRRQSYDNNDGAVNAEEMELRQHLHNVEQERDQVGARDPSHAMQLEEEVRRLAQIVDDMQRQSRVPGWIIMLDGESPISTEIMCCHLEKLPLPRFQVLRTNRLISAHRAI